MIITKVEKYKGQTYLVQTDSGKTYFLHRSIVAEHSLCADKEIDAEAFEMILRKAYLRKAYERALYLLDVRDYSYTEMFEKLNSCYDDDICYETMEKLVKLGMIDDRRYAQNLARKLVEVKKHGYYKAIFEMRQKGLDKTLCEEALSEYEDSYRDRLYELIVRKYSRCFDDEKGIAKLKNTLARQGYGFDDINCCIKTYLEENEI